MSEGVKLIKGAAALKQMEMCWEWYFPPEARGRFEAQADVFESKTLEEWEQRWWARKEDLSSALEELGKWSGEADTSLLITGWDDELIFWHVMRMQSLAVMLASNPESYAPANLEEFWQRHVMHLTTWMEFVFPVGGAFLKLARRPKIWRIAWPAGQGTPPELLTGDPLKRK